MPHGRVSSPGPSPPRCPLSAPGRQVEQETRTCRGVSPPTLGARAPLVAARLAAVLRLHGRGRLPFRARRELLAAPEGVVLAAARQALPGATVGLLYPCALLRRGFR